MRTFKKVAVSMLIVSFIHLIFLNAGVFSEDLSPTPDMSQKISMDFDGVSLKDVLKIFSQQSGFNFVASEAIESKKVTIFFENVTVADALDSILTANGLRTEQNEGSSIFAVYPANGPSARLQTKVFFLKYTRLSTSSIDIGGFKTSSDLSQVAQTGSSSTSGSSNSSSGSSSSSLPSAAKSPKSATERGIDQLVASLLSDQGKVTLDLPTNSLIVTDNPAKIREISEVLEKIDVPSSQVMLEVYLMEVKKDIASDIGVDWGGADGALATFTGGSRTTSFPFAETLFSASKGVKASTEGTSTLTLGTLSATNFRATLRFVLSDTHTKILARPRVLTLNNESANIKLVTNAAIANTSTLSTAEGQATSTGDVAERTEVGINLKMTPQVNEDESIQLFLEPSVTTVTASSFFPTTFLDPTTRSVRTIVRVKNNETLVIGGLMDSNKTLTRKRIPVLGDLPLVGYAFDYDEKDDTERELLIFITPRIVRNSSLNLYEADRDAAAKRMLDVFKDEEVDKTLLSFDDSKPIYPSKFAVSSKMDQEMVKALKPFEKK